MIESIQDYVRINEIEKKVIEINISGDDDHMP